VETPARAAISAMVGRFIRGPSRHTYMWIDIGLNA
jgi:hypothetical protein